MSCVFALILTAFLWLSYDIYSDLISFTRKYGWNFWEILFAAGYGVFAIFSVFIMSFFTIKALME